MVGKFDNDYYFLFFEKVVMYYLDIKVFCLFDKKFFGFLEIFC